MRTSAGVKRIQHFIQFIFIKETVSLALKDSDVQCREADRIFYRQMAERVKALERESPAKRTEQRQEDTDRFNARATYIISNLTNDGPRASKESWFKAPIFANALAIKYLSTIKDAVLSLSKRISLSIIE